MNFGDQLFFLAFVNDGVLAVLRYSNKKAPFIYLFDKYAILFPLLLGLSNKLCT